jgi:hypothetical protein
MSGRLHRYRCSAAPSEQYSAVLLEQPLGQRRAHLFQPLQGAEDLRLIVGEMAHDYVGVPELPKRPNWAATSSIDPAFKASAGMPR